MGGAEERRQRPAVGSGGEKSREHKETSISSPSPMSQARRRLLEMQRRVVRLQLHAPQLPSSGLPSRYRRPGDGGKGCSILHLKLESVAGRCLRPPYLPPGHQPEPDTFFVWHVWQARLAQSLRAALPSLLCTTHR